MCPCVCVCVCMVDPGVVYDWLQNYSPSRRITVFLTAVARQFVNGDCYAANLKIFLKWYPLISIPVGSSEKGRLHTPLHWLSLHCPWSNLVTLSSRPTAPCLAGSGALTEIKLGAFYPYNPTSGIWSIKRRLKFCDCAEKLNIKCDGGGAEQIRRRVTGLSTTSTPWKFDSVSRRNSTAPRSSAWTIVTQCLFVDNDLLHSLWALSEVFGRSHSSRLGIVELFNLIIELQQQTHMKLSLNSGKHKDTNSLHETTTSPHSTVHQRFHRSSLMWTQKLSVISWI